MKFYKKICPFFKNWEIKQVLPEVLTVQFLVKKSDYLIWANQSQEGHMLLETLSKKYPDNISIAIKFANQLEASGEINRAIDFLGQLLISNKVLYEKRNIQSAMNQILHNKQNFIKIQKMLEKWIAQDEKDNKLNSNFSSYYHYYSIYARYVSILEEVGNFKKSHSVLKSWFKDGLGQEPLSTLNRHRLLTAIKHVCGNGRWYSGYVYQINRKYLPELQAVVKRWMTDKKHYTIARQVLLNGRFRNTEENRLLVKEVVDYLLKKDASIKAGHFTGLFNAINTQRAVIGKEKWKPLGEYIFKKWKRLVSAKSFGEKELYAQAYVTWLKNSLGHAVELQSFMTLRLKEAGKNEKSNRANELFTFLLNSKFSKEKAEKLFEILNAMPTYLVNPANQETLLKFQVEALHVLIAQLPIKEMALKFDLVKDLEKLSRKQRKVLRVNFKKEARANLLKRLISFEKKVSGRFKKWVKLERLRLQILMKKDLDKVYSALNEVLNFEIKNTKKFETVHLQRVLKYYSLLALKSGQKSRIAKKILKYLEDTSKEYKGNVDFRYQIIRLLMAQGNAKRIFKLLPTWIDKEKADPFWRMMLAYFNAEMGLFAEAIGQLEELEKNDQMNKESYHLLSQIYLLKGKEKKYKESLIKMYESTHEHHLIEKFYAISNVYYQNRKSWPLHIDPSLFLIIPVLLKKSSNPGNFAYELSMIFKHTKDHRLLQCYVDAMEGHSSGTLYGYLKSFKKLIDGVFEESAIQRIHEKIVEKQANPKLSDLDRRTLTLIYCLSARRASLIKKNDQQYLKQVEECLKESFKGSWEKGESLLYAKFLHSLGKLKPALVNIHIGLFKKLDQLGDQTFADQIAISYLLAKTLGGVYGDHAQACLILENALQQINAQTNFSRTLFENLVNTYVEYLCQQSHYKAAEKMVHLQSEKDQRPDLHSFYHKKLMLIYFNAFKNSGEVSFGSGPLLYAGVVKWIKKVHSSTNKRDLIYIYDSYLSFLVLAKSQLCHPQKDLLKFSRAIILASINRFDASSRNKMLSKTVISIQDVVDAREGYRFIVEVLESKEVYSWFNSGRNGYWDTLFHKACELRVKAKSSSLDARYFPLCQKALRHGLINSGHFSYLFSKHSSHFWKEKENEFYQLVKKVAEANTSSGLITINVARYLFDYLKKPSEAIELLKAARARKVLSLTGSTIMVEYMISNNQYQDVIEPLQELISVNPLTYSQRDQLMQAYFKTNQKEKLKLLFAETEAYYKSDDWNSDRMAQLATTCIVVNKWKDAIRLYKELISKTLQTMRIGGRKDQLSSYYSELSKAYFNLGEIQESIDAACWAIIKVGDEQYRKDDVIEKLEKIFVKMENLDDYSTDFEKKVLDSKEENSLVRRAIGMVYLNKMHAYQKAIIHLNKYLISNPNDIKVRESLLVAYQKTNNPKMILNEYRELLKISSHDIYQQLAFAEKILKVNSREGERALTGIIENMAHESESHELLAEIRESQGMLNQAKHHWHHVNRIRSLEPKGLLNICRLLLKQKKTEEAFKLVQKLRKKIWPSRFGNISSKIKVIYQDSEFSLPQ